MMLYFVVNNLKYDGLLNIPEMRIFFYITWESDSIIYPRPNIILKWGMVMLSFVIMCEKRG
jgi:hypothetical protein